MNGKKSLTRSRKFRERVTAVVAAAGAIAMTAGFMMMAAAGPANADWGGIPNYGNSDKGSVENSSDDGAGNSEDAPGHSTEGPGNSDNGNGNGNGNANGQGQGNQGKTDVCHATNSMTNPYVFINVSVNAVDHGKGHWMHKYEPNKIWKDGAWWNGTWYDAGDPRPDYIAWDGDRFTEASCEASPTGALEVTPSISLVDPCETANDTASAVSNAGYTSVKNGNVFTFTANPGYTLMGSNVLTAVFTNNGACSTTGPTPVSEPPTVGATDVCPNLAGVQTVIPGGYDKNCKPPKVAGTETASPEPVAPPAVVKGTEAVPTAVAAGIGGNGPTVTGSSPIDLLAQMLVGGGLALLMAAGWLRIGRQTRGVHQA